LKIRKIGKRGVLFTFEDGDSPIGCDTSVYLVLGDKRAYLCDTFLGPQWMDVIKLYLRDTHYEGRLVVFNSHSDFDHVWGNGAFEDSNILAHTLTRKRMKERWEFDYSKFSRFRRDEVSMRLPNITFNDGLFFEDDGIEFRHAPGHTVCSSICLDWQESVLFAGDLLEEPVPVTLWGDLVTFTETLKSLRDLNFSTVISAHSGVVGPELCDRNIEYIKDLLLRKEVAFPAGADEGAHPFNVKYLQYLKYEELARAKEGKSFDLSKFKREFWALAGYGQDRMAEESKIIKETPPERYEEAWERYLRR